MKTINSYLGSLVAVMMLGYCATSISFAAEEQQSNVNSFLCRDILRVAGDERDIAVAFMHGYLLGKSGKETFDRPTLSAATDGFIEACLNNVDAVAVKTLKNQLK